jgi:hypothetical protein
MKLTSMKMSASERKKSGPTIATGSDAPQYPYGLALSLDNESLDKLGLGLPEVGSKFALHAMVEVTSVSASEHGKGEKQRSVSLQITDMALATAGDTKQSSEVLYGKP